MSNNPYTAPDELITGGHVTKECNSVTVLFDDIHYSLSSGQLNGGFHHTLGVRNQQLTYHIVSVDKYRQSELKQKRIYQVAL